ncbi:MAG: tetratricopeptide repeat protein [Rhizobiaceae bacterium]
MDHSPALSSPAVPPFPVVLGRVAGLMGAGDYGGAIAMLLAEGARVRQDAIASHTLALLLLQAERAREAIPWFEAALALKPANAAAMTGLSMALHTAGDLQRAALSYEKALALDPGDAATWYHQGAVRAELGEYADALASLDKAIALKRDYGAAFARRAGVLDALGNMPEAIEAAVRCCRLSPDEASSWALLGDLFQKDGHFEQAIAAYDRGLSLAPSDFPCLCNKAHALKEAGRAAEALQCAQAALNLDRDNRGLLLVCGYAELDLGNAGAARQRFLAVAEKGVAKSYPSTKRPPVFRVLMLFSPLGGNTPYEDLIKGSTLDADLLIVMPDHRYESPRDLTAKVDIIVNLVSEPDNGRQAIMAAADFVNAQERPVINSPQLILGTDREMIARRLAGIADTVMPVTIRIDAGEVRQRFPADAASSTPLIVRHAGMHGGEMMELVSEPEALMRFAEEAGDRPLYLTDYVDYGSADGHFRKYRFIFVGEEILPYHLAIGDGWKVHHASTRMREIEWMRKEEQAFLEHPQRVFGRKGMAALEEVRRRIGLDYFGIDCSLDRDGKVVIFEVNASMLIHLRNEGFDYKTPYVMRIKAAFEQMLVERIKSAGIRRSINNSAVA